MNARERQHRDQARVGRRIKIATVFSESTSRTAFEKKRQGSVHSFFDLALLL